MRILVVEDESAIAQFVERGLRSAGYAVDRAADGEAGERRVLTGQYDLVLLDILLPGKDGLEVLGAIREHDRQTPVILLTALGEIEDRVRGLDRGATDYVVKPFSMEELLARVRAHLRRPHQPAGDLLEVGDLRMDLRTRKFERGAEEVTLTAREFALIAYLMRHPGQVLSREQILNAVWGFDHEPGTNVLEVYVSYLRNKLRSDGSDAPIETVRGAGYRLLDSSE
jgi:DNA-binding response OmpR family regulator